MGDGHEVRGAADVEEADAVGGSAGVILQIFCLGLVEPWRAVACDVRSALSEE